MACSFIQSLMKSVLTGQTLPQTAELKKVGSYLIFFVATHLNIGAIGDHMVAVSDPALDLYYWKYLIERQYHQITKRYVLFEFDL